MKGLGSQRLRLHSDVMGVRLQSGDNSDDGDTEQDSEDVNNKEINASEQEIQKGDNPVAKIFDATFLFASFVIQFLGVAFSFGLLLNLCGYGYMVDLEKGVHIDTLDKIRTEKQFEREMQRSTTSD